LFPYTTLFRSVNDELLGVAVTAAEHRTQQAASTTAARPGVALVPRPAPDAVAVQLAAIRPDQAAAAAVVQCQGSLARALFHRGPGAAATIRLMALDAIAPPQAGSSGQGSGERHASAAGDAGQLGEALARRAHPGGGQIADQPGLQKCPAGTPETEQGGGQCQAAPEGEFQRRLPGNAIPAEQRRQVGGEDHAGLTS